MLHKGFRDTKMIFTQKFIGTAPDDVIQFDKNYQMPLKKKKTRRHTKW